MNNSITLSIQGRVRQGSNSNPSPMFSSATTANFAENATGTVLTVVASPVDSYSIKPVNDGNSFNINTISGAVTFKTPADYETKSSYSLTVIATKGTKTTEQTITISITDVEEWYGVQIDESQSSPDLTRIASSGGAMTLHASLPIQSSMKACLLNESGSVNYYLDPTDWTKKVDGSASNLSGADGDVMIEIPEFYYGYELASAGVHNLKISTKYVSGFKKSLKRYVSAYEAALNRSTLKLSSVKNNTTTYRGGNNLATYDGTGKTLVGDPVTGVVLSEMRTYAKNKGSDRWHIYDYQTNKILIWLFVIEYATLNSQKSVDANLTAEGYKKGGLGNGVTTVDATEWANYFSSGFNPFIACGTSDSLASSTGEFQYAIPSWSGTTGTVKIARYRGIENIFGHMSQYIDGINIYHQTAGEGSALKTYVCKDPSRYLSGTLAGYLAKSNLPASIIGAAPYITKVQLGSDLDTIPIEATGGSANTYYSDYAYIDAPTGVWRGMISSGPNELGGCALLTFNTTIVTASQTSLTTRLGFVPYSNVLILGNSITYVPGIYDYWWGSWGMAASTRENDFGHQLENKLQLINPDCVVNGQNIADWERNHATYDKSNFDSYFASNPDLVILRMGENVSDPTNFNTSIQALINYIWSKVPDAKIFICGAFMTNARDTVLSAAATANGLGYTELYSLFTTPNKSVEGDIVYGDDGQTHILTATTAGHPNDAGMLAIANKIYDAIM